MTEKKEKAQKKASKKIVESTEKHVDRAVDTKAALKEHKGQDSIEIGYVNGGGGGN